MDGIKKAIVTGANGFLGGALVQELLDNRYDVIGLDITQPRFSNSSGNFTFLHASFEDYKNVDKLKVCQDADMIFHFAWAGVSGDMREQWTAQLDNMRYSCDLMQTAAHLYINKFIYPGSVTEFEHYKAYQMGFYPFPAKNSYHVAKHATRHMLRVVADMHGIKFYPLILSNIYGCRYESDKITNTMLNSSIKAMIDNEKTSFTVAEQMYDFLYMDDAVRAIRLVAENGKTLRDYYIGNRIPRQLKEFLLEVEQAIKPQHPLGIGEVSFEGVSLDYNEFDMNGIYEDLNFEPEVSFIEGIKITADRMKQKS